jgi:GT2 family glycosyltransferase
MNKVSVPEIQETDFISGGACMIRTEIFIKAGLFEEKYFAYLDEIDLMKRIRELGNYKILVTSKSIVWHNHNWSKTNKHNYYFEYFLMERNKFLYYHKYRFYTSMILMLSADIIKFPWRLRWFMKICNFKLGIFYLRGMLDGVLNKQGRPKFSFIAK